MLFGGGFEIVWVESMLRLSKNERDGRGHTYTFRLKRTVAERESGRENVMYLYQ